MQYKGYIFDFDGTIIDTEKYHYISWQQAFALENCPLSEEQYTPYKSTGGDATVNYLEERIGRKLSAERRLEIITAKRSSFKQLTANIGRESLIPGIIEYLETLKSSGVKLAVASSSISAKETLELLNMTQYFDTIIDGTDVIAKKPDPAIFLKSAEKLQLAPTDCVVFEDSYAGIEAGNRANMQCVFIGKYPPKAKLLQIHPDFTNIEL